jgi:hypothetical protein
VLVQHIIDLLAEAVAGPLPEESRPSRAWQAAMYVNASKLIRARLSDPDLDPEEIAGDAINSPPERFIACLPCAEKP